MATTLNGREVTANVSIDDLARPYKSTNPAFVGKSYHIGRWGKLGFTASPELYSAMKKGLVEQITLEESEYERQDAATGAKVKVASATLVTWQTLDQVLALDGNETKKIEAGTKLQVAKAKAEVTVKGAKITAMKELGLDGVEMKELLAMV